MKLGNTGGKNKGKKYIKIKGNEPITPINQINADSFMQWFGVFYTRLQKELIAKDTYDEDTLNDTFLRIYDKIRFGGLEIKDYKAYFHRAFFTNFMQDVFSKTKIHKEPLEILGDLVDNVETNEYYLKKRQVNYRCVRVC